MQSSMSSSLSPTQFEVPDEAPRFSPQVSWSLHLSQFYVHLDSPSAIHWIHARSFSHDGLRSSANSSRSYSTSNLRNSIRETVQSTSLPRNHGFTQSSCSLFSPRHLFRCLATIAVQQRSYRNASQSCTSCSSLSQTHSVSSHYVWQRQDSQSPRIHRQWMATRMASHH